MPNRKKPLWLPIALLALALAGGGSSWADELIKTSELNKPSAPFRLKRNPFSMSAFSGLASSSPAATSARQEEEEEKEDIEQQLRQSVAYNGFIQRQGKNAAILNISGEYVIATEGETVMEKIKVLKIEPLQVTIEYEGQTFTIQSQGEDDG